MSGTTTTDVVLRARIGAYATARRQRGYIGSSQRVYVDVLDRVTGERISSYAGATAMVWLPGTLGTDSPAQNLPITQHDDGSFSAEFTPHMPGTWRFVAAIAEPSAETISLPYDVADPAGQPVSIRPEDWNALQMAGAAAGASAAVLEARDVAGSVGAEAGAAAALAAGAPYVEIAQQSAAEAQGYAVASETAANAATAAEIIAVDAADIAVSKAAEAGEAGAAAGAEAGAAAAAPHAEAAAQSEEIALGAADMSREERIAAEAARVLADQRAGDAEAERLRAEAAANGTVAAAIGPVIQRETLALLNAATGVTDGMVGEVYGLNADRGRYRRMTGAWVRESDTLPQVQQTVAGIPARRVKAPRAGLIEWQTDRKGRIYRGIDKDGRRFFVAGQTFEILPDDVLRWQSLAGGTPLDLRPDGIETTGNRVALSGQALRSEPIVSLGGYEVWHAHLDARRQSIFRYGPRHMSVAGMWVERHADGSWTLSGPRGVVLRVRTTGRPEFVGARLRAANLPGSHLAIQWADGRLSGFRIDSADGALRLVGRNAAPAAPPDEPLSLLPYFADTLWGVRGVPLSIHLANLLERRDDARLLRLSVASSGGATAVYDASAGPGERVDVDAGRLWVGSQLIIRRAKWDGAQRVVLPLQVRSAPLNPSVAPTPRVLMIGDSIINRGAARFSRDYLQSWGYAPTFVGTVLGAYTGSADATDGLPGEGREGWECGDYTYAVTDRAQIVAPGSEAAYLAASKAVQRETNPFLRAATAGDAAQDINNGYVLDFAAYCSRFGVATPDVVVWECGTNDIRDRPASEVFARVYAADMLMYRRMRAAWPSAKIIRMLPGTSRDATRDALWTAAYIPLIKAMRQAVKDTADANIVLAPTWAMANQDAGYTTLAGTTDPATGATTTTLNDSIHPIGATRAELWRATAGYIACAAS